MSNALSYDGVVEVSSPNVSYTEEEIVSTYTYQSTDVRVEESKTGAPKLIATPKEVKYEFRTKRVAPKTGVMIVG